MSILFVADVHLGNHRMFAGQSVAGLNERCRSILRALDLVADEETHLVSLGDFFDVDKPPPSLIAAAQWKIDKFHDATMLLGNHEMSGKEKGHNAIAPLWPVAEVVDTPRTVVVGDVELVCVPYQAGSARDWLEDAVEAAIADTADTDHRVLCLHLGIADEETAEYLKHAEDSIEASRLFDIMQRFDIRWAVAGNWHEQKTWRFWDVPNEVERVIYQVGCLVPTGFNNPGVEDYGTVLHMRSDATFDSVRVPGPRFMRYVVESRRQFPFDDLRRTASCDEVTALYASVTTRPDLAGEMEDRLEELRVAKVIAGYTVRLDRRIVADDAEERRDSIRDTTSVEEAVETYIEEMTLPKGVRQREVKKVVVEHLKL